MKTENILPDLTTPRVMAIVNVTPDSFFAGSRTPDAEAIERRVREAADAGCDLFDVGGYSSRSGAAEVTPEEEWRRVEAGWPPCGGSLPHCPFRSIRSVLRWPGGCSKHSAR